MKLLLDGHLSPDIATGLRARKRHFPITTLSDWHDGRFLSAPDAAILEQAAREKLTFVTYDCKTIPPLLKSWTEAGSDFGGIILIDEKTIAPSDFGALIRALEEVVQHAATWDWTNRVIFLRR